MHGSALAKYAGVITGGLRWRAIDISRDIVSYELSGWIMIKISPVSFLLSPYLDEDTHRGSNC